MGETYVMSSVRVFVDTTQESGGSVLADIRQKQATTSRMLAHERRQIVDKPSNENERASLGLFLDWENRRQ